MGNSKKGKAKSKSKGASHREKNRQQLLSDGVNIGGQMMLQANNAKNGKNAAGMSKNGMGAAQLPDLSKKMGYVL